MRFAEESWRRLYRGESAGPGRAAARAGLTGLGALYSGLVTLHRASFRLGLARAARAPRPVISVGNITLGGTGKTPVVQWVAQRLLELGERPAILSRGYGGANREALLVVSRGNGPLVSAAEAGDEPCMLAATLPGVAVVVGRRRQATALIACGELDATVCILDDGFQYQRLHHDLDIVLVDAREGFGNHRVFPAGPLRESTSSLGRADIFILTDPSSSVEDAGARIAQELHRLNPGAPQLPAVYRPVSARMAGQERDLSLDNLRGADVLALSALGRPAGFEESIRQIGGFPVERIRYRDHYRYSARDLVEAGRRAAAAGCRFIVTTEKDAVKLEPEWIEKLPCPLVVLRVGINFPQGAEELDAAVRTALGWAQPA